MSYQPTWRERLEDAKPYIGPAIAGVVVLALAGWVVWYFATGQNAKTIAHAAPQDEAARMEAFQRVSAEVTMREKTYQNALESGANEGAATDLLNRLIEKQRELIRLEAIPTTTQLDRLTRWETARDALRSQMALARSRVLEKEAEVARLEGRTNEAVEKLREAQRLQFEANQNAASIEYKDAPRESQLGLIADQTEAEPLARSVSTSLTLAHSAIAREQWEEAIKAFGEARRIQTTLNQRFPTTRFADLKAIDRLDGEIETLRAADLAGRVSLHERTGDAAAKAGRPADAASAYALAENAQREVNEKFPRSRYVSLPRAEELEVRQQTVLSSVPMERAAALDREVATLLRRRETAAVAEKIAAAAKLVDQAAAEFPRSTALDAPLQRRLGYLARRAGGLSTLQEQLYAQLAPLPGTGNLQLFKTEVSQEVYQRVMDLNPSRNVGPGLPVDSVSWLDAREFCLRASWILGLRVRLPTEAEFSRVWAASADAWAAENSGGRSREIGKSSASPAGFFDLAGNLAEWLQPEGGDAGESAPVAGGSYLDKAEALKLLRVTPQAKRERASHIGFRVMVERVVE